MVKKLLLLFIFTLTSIVYGGCGESSEALVYRYYVSIDVREDGECKVPLIYGKIYDSNSLGDKYRLYTNPDYGIWGNAPDSIDPHSKFRMFMVQNCRMLIGLNSDKTEELEIHVINLQTGMEAHEYVSLKPLDILSFDECKFLKTDDGLEYDIHKDMDKYRKCGNRLKNEVQYTINLQPPQSDEAFDWVTELECQPIN